MKSNGYSYMVYLNDALLSLKPYSYSFMFYQPPLLFCANTLWMIKTVNFHASWCGCAEKVYICFFWSSYNSWASDSLLGSGSIHICIEIKVDLVSINYRQALWMLCKQWSDIFLYFFLFHLPIANFWFITNMFYNIS